MTVEKLHYKMDFPLIRLNSRSFILSGMGRVFGGDQPTRLARILVPELLGLRVVAKETQLVRHCR